MGGTEKGKRRSLKPYAERGLCAESTPKWNTLGWHGMHREGVGAVIGKANRAMTDLTRITRIRTRPGWDGRGMSVG